MKRILPFLVLLSMFTGIAVIISCKKEPVLPVLTSTDITSITLTSAVSGGNITSDGRAAITAKGICWATTTGPTIDNDKTSDGTGSGSFVSNLSGLQPGVTYYVRAYATNKVGTAYGNEVTFATTAVVVPTLTTTPATLITLTTAVTGGNITADGGGAVTARGVCWATTANPTITNSKTTDGTGIGSFISNLSGLLQGTTYHVRAYATNSAGTAYGNDITFPTGSVVVPTLTTTPATLITLTTAVTGGNITADGGGDVTARGVCWATSANPTITGSKTTDGTGTGSFLSNLSGLLPGTTYHVRAYATNSAGTAYGNDITFPTSSIVVPTLTTTTVTGQTLNSAVSGGNITTDGGANVTARGVCWATTSNPTVSNSKTTDGTGTGSFTSNLTGLQAATVYYVRAYATNSAGTGYGNEVSFTSGQIVVPTLTTAAIASFTQTTAVSGGNVLTSGGGTVTGRGVCWATTANPTIANNVTNDGTGTGSFTSNLTGLTAGTTYHVRAYAANSAGTAYGNEVIFTSGPVILATLTTTAVTSFTQTTAVSGGNITADGGGAITARGVCWATTANPTISDSKTTNGTGTGSYSSNLTGLSAGTTYHVRAYATNSAGTAYGNDVSFVTSPVLIPTLTTVTITSITTTTAVSGGTISSDGGGAISVKGVCWSTATNPTIGGSKTTDGTGTAGYSSNLSGLTPGTLYYVRAYATNSAGTAYGNELTFTSVPTAVPNVATAAITSIDVTTATSGGNITVAGAGTITSKGVCWATTPGPTTSDSKTTDGTGTGSFTSNLSSLTSGTSYYVRAYATNAAGTGYGNEISFNTKIADGEGNKYTTITLGSQVWMKENLKTVHYNNGDTINTIATDIWAAPTSSYQWTYNNNAGNEADTYGRLYNFYAITDARGVCPAGFHIPSNAEWTTLSDFLVANGFGFGGSGSNIGKAIASTSGWTSSGTAGDVGNNQVTNNASGFTSLPAGFRKGDATFNEINSSEYFWSSTPDPAAVPQPAAFYKVLQYNFPYWGTSSYGPWNGYSVRCVK